MGDLSQLSGARFGPFDVAADPERVDAFARAVGDDPTRWTDQVPPMFANAVLFSAAPAFLDDERVVPFTRSLIHSEQTYEWVGVLPVGAEGTVSGAIEVVRVRGPLNLVTFGIEADSGAGPWLRGTSVFLMADEAAAAAEEAAEPPEDVRPEMDAPAPRIPVPEPGEEIPPLQCGASRADLRRYAEASGDSNPIHLEHDAATAAGLPGVIVHGLLMGAWMARAAERVGDLASLRLRFRNPLRPATGAVVTGSVSASDAVSVDLALTLTAGDERLVTGRATVTP